MRVYVKTCRTCGTEYDTICTPEVHEFLGTRYPNCCQECRAWFVSEGLSGDAQDEIDRRYEASEPEEAFGPHLGSGLRAELEARVSYFRRNG